MASFDFDQSQNTVATASTSNLISLPSGTNQIYFSWFESILPLLEDDKTYQLKQRKLRYSPFTVKPKQHINIRSYYNTVKQYSHSLAFSP